MARLSSLVVATLAGGTLLAGTLQSAAAPAAVPAEPRSAQARNPLEAMPSLAAVPTARLRTGEEQAVQPRVVASRAARGPSRLDGAARARVITYRTTAVTGRPARATGLVLVPEGRRPRGGWPVVVYDHITTGAGDTCGPSTGTAKHPEASKMQQGDDVTRDLLAQGVLVIRPDYEGIGTKGPHPYLHGPSLARNTVDMLRAVQAWRPGWVGKRWVVSGHSEGGVAALYVARRGMDLVPGMRLMGASAFTPVTQMDQLVKVFQVVPVASPGLDVLVALAGLLLKGLTAVDPSYRRLLLDEGGLSPAAKALWPQLEERCLTELTRADSWGGLAPASVVGPGPAGQEALNRLVEWLAAGDVADLRLRRGLPIRLDLGLLDLVAPIAFTHALVGAYQAQGNPVDVGYWPEGHSPTNSEAHAAPAAAAWMVAQLRR